jgi:hypothetical protein
MIKASKQPNPPNPHVAQCMLDLVGRQGEGTQKARERTLLEISRAYHLIQPSKARKIFMHDVA